MQQITPRCEHARSPTDIRPGVARRNGLSGIDYDHGSALGVAFRTNLADASTPVRLAVDIEGRLGRIPRGLKR